MNDALRQAIDDVRRLLAAEITARDPDPVSLNWEQWIERNVEHRSEAPAMAALPLPPYRPAPTPCQPAQIGDPMHDLDPDDPPERPDREECPRCQGQGFVVMKPYLVPVPDSTPMEDPDDDLD